MTSLTAHNVHIKAKRSTFFHFLLASFLSSFWYLRADMRYLSTMGWQHYDETKNLVLPHMQMDPNGHFYFPLYPWSIIMVVMNCFPLVIVSISIALVFLCLNLMIAIDFIKNVVQDKVIPVLLL